MALVRSALLVAALGVAAWFGLDALRPKARWLALASPAIAVPGRSLPVELRFLTDVPAGRVAVDLHAREPASGRSMVVGVFQTNLNSRSDTFRLDVPIRPATTSGFVRVVVYLSPTGAWKDRTLAAISGDIPLEASANPAASDSKDLVRRLVFNLGGPSTITRVRIVPIRAATALLWLGVALAAFRLLRHPPGSGQPTLGSGRSWRTDLRILGIACALAAVAEATDLTGHLGEAARSVARRFAAYDGREPVQQAVSAGVIGLTFAMGLVVVRSREREPLSVALAITFSALGLLGLDSLSLHAFDEAAEVLCVGVPLVQWAGLACALAAAIAVARLVRGRGRQPGHVASR